MPGKITLAIASGKLQGQEFTFSDRATCIIGRADDCYPQLPDDEDHRTILIDNPEITFKTAAQLQQALLQAM